ncbi:aldehyde dehydrogenase family protein [Formosa sp. S-31]|uniref:aldehyde dehydrogenase family protein n=1 Tax=Formosa sp. S-31 TaxID=2790949 RepID=UPI003EBD23DB
MNNQYQELFDSQKENQYALGNSTFRERIEKLEKLKQALEHGYKQQIREALYKDFKKPHLETDLTEIYPVISEIKFVKQRLKGWLKPQKVKSPLVLVGSSSYYVYEPKGVCLIISPWNFPLNLTFGPLVSALAAGNTVILKPSELTPHIARVMEDIITSIFKPNEVKVVQGAVAETTALLQLPFNHIFFTGSPQIGKLVMQAAAKHLTSVTLELGGKSPTIVDKSADLKEAAKRIAWGKFVNSGQICVSPDYVFVHEAIKADFIKEMKLVVSEFYGANAETSASYGRIVNAKHTGRLQKHIQNAKDLQGTVELGGHFNADENYISPTVISNLPEEATLLQEEIFGPVLPLKVFKEISEVVSYINSKPRPLALYIYSKNKSQIKYISANTRAGSMCVNTNVLQYSNHNLPFGGVNNSGIGKAHGLFGFQEFSNRKSVLKQFTRGSIELLFPPYTDLKQKLVDLTLKWF